MKQAKISDQAADVAYNVTETLGDALSTGLEKSKVLVSAAADRLPDTSTAADWTRQHVPGMTPPKSRRATVKSWLPLFAAIAVVAGLVWWFRRDSNDITYDSTRS
ncbi:hypothetical protein BH20ACT4_BH20ACT4_06990 [soil metagenome]